MLAYILALTVGLGSLVIYMAAFFFPEVHRKGDFIWSGVGLFYALILWVCSARITGAVLLGQMAGVALLGWSVSQTLTLRRQVPVRGAQQTELPSTEEVKNTVKEKVANSSFFGRLSPFTKRGGSANEAKNRLQENLGNEASTSTTTDSAIKIIDNRTPLPQPVSNPVTAETTTTSVSESEPDLAAFAADNVESIAPGEQDSVTEDSAIAPVVENTNPDFPSITEEPAPTVTEDSAIASVGDNSTTEELVRPQAPDPELVEAAIKDAEEKHQQASPPDPNLENPSN